MITILLTILKIIGLVLLCVIAFVLLVALIIIFVPIPYAVKATFNGSVKDYKISARLYGIPLPINYFMKRGERKKKREEAKGEKSKKEKKVKSKTVEVEKPASVVEAAGSESAGDTEGIRVISDGDSTDVKSDNVVEVKPDNIEGVNSAKQSGDSSGKKKEGHKFSSATEDTKEKTGGLLDKIRSIKDMAVKVLGILKDKNNTSIIVKILKHIRPRKIRASMVIGLPDPSNTGLLFGGLSILMVIWPGKYKLRPDFENEVLKGNITAKGIVSVILLAIYAIKILKIINQFKKENEKGSVKNGSTR